MAIVSGYTIEDTHSRCDGKSQPKVLWEPTVRQRKVRAERRPQSVYTIRRSSSATGTMDILERCAEKGRLENGRRVRRTPQISSVAGFEFPEKNAPQSRLGKVLYTVTIAGGTGTELQRVLLENTLLNFPLTFCTHSFSLPLRFSLFECTPAISRAVEFAPRVGGAHCVVEEGVCSSALSSEMLVSRSGI